MKAEKCILIFLLVSFITSCHTERKESKTDLISMLNEETLKEDQVSSFLNNNIALLDNIELVNSKGEKVLLKDIVKGEALVIRYSAYSCNDCISFVNENILNNIKYKENILLMISNIPIRDLHVIRKQFGLVDAYHVDSLPLPFDDEQIPYFFILNNDYLSSSFFIPRKEMPEQTKIYLEFVKEKMNNIKKNDIDSRISK